MTIGITGVSGFVGRHFVRHPAAADHRLVGFSRNPARSTPGVVEMRAMPEIGAPDVSRLDAVVHLSGESVAGLWTARLRRAIAESRGTATRRLVAAMASAHPRPTTLVCASAVGLYGDRGDEWLTEESPRGDGFLADVASDWEAAACEAEKAGIRVVRMRFGLVLGPDGGPFVPLRRVIRLGLGGKLGSGRQWMPWVHVDDVAGLLWHALLTPGLTCPVNTVAPHPVTNAEFTRTVARHYHRPAFLHVPAWVLKTALRDQTSMFLFSQRVRPGAAEASGYSFRHPTLAGALETL